MTQNTMFSLNTKIFLSCAIGGFIIYMYEFICLDHYRDYKVDIMFFKSELEKQYLKNLSSAENVTALPEMPLKYILQWTRPDTQPFVYMGVGRQGFIDRKCKFTNCVVTSDRNTLNSLTDYDVILFHGPELVYVPILNKDFPKVRSPRQKYVFGCIESSHYYPICSDRLDNFFNWTWTFRLDSDARWEYILIKDANGTVIGPNLIMHWLKTEDMEPVTEEFREKIHSKNKAAAWFVSNCGGKSNRMKFAKELMNELNKLNLELDIYGKCGPMKCELNEDCDKLIADKYYFYLAFENSFSEDYVTEKLLRGLKNDAVPIVYGGANYTRFLPDGAYLNAREMGVQQTAKVVSELIANPDQYIDYFRWRNHYSYHSRDEGPENNDYCNFCEMINDEKAMTTQTTIKNFRQWWDNPKRC